VPLARRPKSSRQGGVWVSLSDAYPTPRTHPRSFDWLLRKNQRQFSPLGVSLSDLNFHPELPWTQTSRPFRRRQGNSLPPPSRPSSRMRAIPPLGRYTRRRYQDQRSGSTLLRCFSRPFGLDLPASGRRGSFSACSLVNSCRCVSPVRTLRLRNLSSVDGLYRPRRHPSCECDARFPPCYLTVCAPGTSLCS